MDTLVVHFNVWQNSLQIKKKEKEKKINIELPYDPEVHCWVYTQNENTNLKRHM